MFASREGEKHFFMKNPGSAGILPALAEALSVQSLQARCLRSQVHHRIA